MPDRKDQDIVSVSSDASLAWPAFSYRVEGEKQGACFSLESSSLLERWECYEEFTSEHKTHHARSQSHSCCTFRSGFLYSRGVCV